MYLLIFLLRFLTGLKHKVEGLENLQKATKGGPCIIACKHQSAWETIALATFSNNFTIILKNELRYIPLFGFYLKWLGMIFVDRKAGSQAIRSLLKQAQEAVKVGRSIIIFPEGTRTAINQPTNYQAGIGLLYNSLKIPVVPVALNSGVFWQRRSIFKNPGFVTIRFLPPIEPGIATGEFMDKLKTTIESNCQQLCN